MPRANGITRQEILASIKHSGAKTAEQLATELGISQVAVRQHLASLEAENVILVSVERRGLGRPSHRYMLTASGDEQFPRTYEALAIDMIDHLQATQGDSAIQQLFARMRERLVNAVQNRVHDKALPERVAEVARIQTERGYMAEVVPVDEDPNALLLIEHNCPVCVVARKHPNACCDSELMLFRDLLGKADVTRETHIVSGHHICTFRIQSSV